MAKLVSSLIPLVLVPFVSGQLDILAQLSGKKYFGTATDNPELTNASYVKQLGNILDFHQLTPVSIPIKLHETTNKFVFIVGQQHEMGIL